MLTRKEKVLDFIDKYVLLIPIMFAIAVIPLIVRVAYYEPKLLDYLWFSEIEKLTDMYMYYKNQAMMILDGVLLLGYIYLIIRKKIIADFSFLPLFIYFILVSLSAAMSIAPIQTWNGFYGMLESAYAVFGYCMICYYTFTVIRTEKQLKLILGAFAIGTLIMGAIGVSQFIGMDFYDTDFALDLIFPKELAEYKDAMQKRVSDGVVYLSLYNQNYVGVYTCLLVPIGFVFVLSAKNKIQAIISTLLMALVLICLVGSESQAAILALIPGLTFLVIYFGKQYYKPMILTFLICGAMFIGLSVYQGDKNIVSDTVDKIGAGSNWIEEKKLSDITLNDEDFTITYNGETLTFSYYRDEGVLLGVKAFDANGEELEVVRNEENSGYKLADTKYEELEFIFARDSYSNPGYIITSEGVGFFIYYSEVNHTYLYMNTYGRATKLYSSETFYSPVFELMGGFSGRDFIWAKSIPILKKTLILGSGPDTFAFMFPQYDYVDLIQDGWDGILITKPHSLYLQIGIQTGVLSLIMFLMFNAIYIIQSFKIFYRRTLNSWAERWGAGIFVADICFLIVSLANDSTIGVSIIYWTLLGIGFACNNMIQKQMEII